MTRGFPEAARETLANAQLRRNLGKATATIRAKRQRSGAVGAEILNVCRRRNRIVARTVSTSTGV